MGIMTRTGSCWRCLILVGDNQLITTTEGEGVVMMAVVRTAVMVAIVVKEIVSE